MSCNDLTRDVSSFGSVQPFRITEKPLEEQMGKTPAQVKKWKFKHPEEIDKQSVISKLFNKLLCPQEARATTSELYNYLKDYIESRFKE